MITSILSFHRRCRANQRRGRGTFTNDRPPVVGTIGRETGQVRLRVTPDTKQTTLHQHVEQFPAKARMFTPGMMSFHGAYLTELMLPQFFELIDRYDVDGFWVDVLDEWALLDTLNTFPLVVVPERHHLSEPMVEALKGYVAQGGVLLLTGAETFQRFGEQFIGASVREQLTDQTFYLPAADGMTPLYSPAWLLLEPTTAYAWHRLGHSTLTDDRLTDYPSAVIHAVDAGKVIYIPADFFAFFHRARYPMLRSFLKSLLHEALGPLAIRLHAPTGIDMVLRQKAGQHIIHLINLVSGLPNNPHAAAIDEIPLIGPATIEIDLPTPPTSVILAFEDSPMTWDYSDGTIRIILERVHLHAALVVEPGLD